MNKIALTLIALATSAFAFAATETPADKTAKCTCGSPTCENAAAAPKQAKMQAREQRNAQPKMTAQMRKDRVRGMLLHMSNEELAEIEAQIAEIKKLSPEERVEAAKALPPPPAQQQRRAQQERQARKPRQAKPTEE